MASGFFTLLATTLKQAFAKSTNLEHIHVGVVKLFLH